MEIELINPLKLFSRNRLDLIVKYLFANEVLERDINSCSVDIYKDLYIRHILMRTKGVTSSLESNQKINVDEYCTEFEKLIKNIKQDGYNIQNPVEVTNNNLIANGAHRIAVCALFGQQIAIKKVSCGHAWDFNWFCENGFNLEDKQRILKGYIDLKAKNSIIFVVWNPLFKYIENVRAVLNKYFDIVGEVELDFENNHVAFTNSLLEIYDGNIAQNNNDESGILAKADLLSANYLSYKVIVVTNEEKNSNVDIGMLSKKCKTEIRELFNHILPKETFCTVHSSDGEEETRYLGSILLSPNNIKHLKMRLTSSVSPVFLEKVRKISNFLNTKGISDKKEICVIGTGVMNALGVLDCPNSDLDFIIDFKYRENFGWGAVKLSQEYDIGVSSKQANGPIHDNVIIYNDDYHFWYKGIKFANLGIIKDRKSSFARQKDIKHFRQIELFEKMVGNFNQQKMLMERVEFERERRLHLSANSNACYPLKYKNIFERLFSVKNHITQNKKYKIITILGIKIKIRRKY